MGKRQDHHTVPAERTGLAKLAEYRHLHGVILSTVVMVSTLAIGNSARTEASWRDEPAEKQAAVTTAPPPENRTEHTDTRLPPLPADLDWQSLAVGHGDTIEAVLARAGVSDAGIDRVRSLGRPAHYLKRLYPGDTLNVAVRDGRLIVLQYDVFPSRRLQVTRLDRQPGAFDTRIIERPLVKKPVQAHGVIRHSLFRAASEAGLDTPMILELSAIFDWDIDFSHDVQHGDTFSVIYEEHFRGDEKVATGPILAAEFVNGGTAHRAVRYTASNGRAEYFTPDGESMRKLFIRNPVRYSQISSRFDPERVHPILSTIRAHTGVDYAAKTGTPIRAAGNGTVISRGWKGGYGKTVVIEHDNRRSTLYAHMSRYSPEIAPGRKVRQGQTIGYVGRTGRATGPHLHYEFLVDGEHVDPLTVQYEPITIPEALQTDFARKSEELIMRLEKAKPTYLALNN